MFSAAEIHYSSASFYQMNWLKANICCHGNQLLWRGQRPVAWLAQFARFCPLLPPTLPRTPDSTEADIVGYQALTISKHLDSTKRFKNHQYTLMQVMRITSNDLSILVRFSDLHHEIYMCCSLRELLYRSYSSIPSVKGVHSENLAPEPNSQKWDCVKMCKLTLKNLIDPKLRRLLLQLLVTFMMWLLLLPTKWSCLLQPCTTHPGWTSLCEGHLYVVATRD